MSDKSMSYEESIKELNILNNHKSKWMLNGEIMRLTILCSNTLQYLEKLGLLQEFYDEEDLPKLLRMYCNELKKCVVRKP